MEPLETDGTKCVLGWMDGQMIDKRMNDGEINGWVDELLDGCTDGCVDGVII